MKLLNKLTFLLFAVVMLALAACGPSATPVPTATPVPPPPTAVPTPVPTKAALNLGEAMGKYNSALPDGFGGLAPAKAQEQLAAAKVFVLDVREPSEITANGYIDGAVNIPIRTLAKNLDKLPSDKSTPVITYCAIGHRGAQAMATLQLLGYTNVKSILGGYNAWKAANLPVKTDAIAAPKAGTAPVVDAELLAALDKYLSGLPDGFGGVAPAALKDQLAATKVFLLDVRETSEVTTNGTIEGAVNIPIRDLAKSLSKLPADKSTPIVTYCAIGHRGSFAMMYLQMMGYTNVKSILGGFNAWKGANLPVKTM